MDEDPSNEAYVLSFLEGYWRLRGRRDGHRASPCQS
jgi:hypothetical protein